VGSEEKRVSMHNASTKKMIFLHVMAWVVMERKNMYGTSTMKGKGAKGREKV
jgi:hypothetical protein